MYRICNPFNENLRTMPSFVKKPLSEINSGDPIFYFKHRTDGSVQSVFHVNVIHLLDDVFVYNGLKFLSEKQKCYFTKYFYQAGIATDRINNSISDPYKNMDQTFLDLDAFLGSYLGNSE